MGELLNFPALPERSWPEIEAVIRSKGLAVNPVAITFHKSPPDGIKRFEKVFPESTPDGRTGAKRQVASSGSRRWCCPN
jgi:hypothetical protein